MITAELFGGLGNQIFIIISVISYAFEHNIPFYFEYRDIYHGWRKKHYWDTLFHRLKPFVKLPDDTIKYKVLKRIFGYSPIPTPDNTCNIMFYGYFQSYKYFHSNFEHIYNFLRIEEAKNELRLKYNTIDYDNTIAMHFRLGDYKNLEDMHPIMPASYYIVALREAKHKNVLFFCEDEDVETVTDTIIEINKYYPDLIFTRAPNDEDYNHMLLMSLFNYIIVANSTFSWWSAYFNLNKTKTVCYPYKWMGDKSGHTQKHIDDLFPPEWTKIYF